MTRRPPLQLKILAALTLGVHDFGAAQSPVFASAIDELVKDGAINRWLGDPRPVYVLARPAQIDELLAVEILDSNLGNALYDVISDLTDATDPDDGPRFCEGVWSEGHPCNLLAYKQVGGKWLCVGHVMEANTAAGDYAKVTFTSTSVVQFPGSARLLSVTFDDEEKDFGTGSEAFDNAVRWVLVKVAETGKALELAISLIPLQKAKDLAGDLPVAFQQYGDDTYVVRANMKG